MKNRKWTKAALALSALLFVIWWLLGTGATLAWFSDQDSSRNEFRIGVLEMDVRFKNDTVTQYTPLEGATEVFTDRALYEPGYTQVVYLEIDNTGEVEFNYKVSVTVKGADVGMTAWGEEIYLPDHLRYGVVFGKTEAEMQKQVEDRLTARKNAPEDWDALGTWSETSPYTASDDPQYAALIIYMPEEVDNVANYRGDTQPRVELGITVFAQQADAPME